MTEQLNVQQMAQRLLAADNILILCHKNPDGDTIGCGSALYYALKALEKTTAVLCSDTVPSRYAFTNPRLFKGEFEPRTVIAVDVAGLQLFGENNGVPQFARHVDLCIDHHAGNNGYADFTLLDAGAAAAAELLYQVIAEMGVTITPHIADCLYTGIATDTGCFKFSSTTANTHTVAAKLIEAGCHVEELNTLLFDTKPRERMEAGKGKIAALERKEAETRRTIDHAKTADPQALAQRIRAVLDAYGSSDNAQRNALLKSVIDQVWYSKAKKTKPNDFDIQLDLKPF